MQKSKYLLSIYIRTYHQSLNNETLKKPYDVRLCPPVGRSSRSIFRYSITTHCSSNLDSEAIKPPIRQHQHGYLFQTIRFNHMLHGIPDPRVLHQKPTCRPGARKPISRSGSRSLEQYLQALSRSRPQNANLLVNRRPKIDPNLRPYQNGNFNFL